MNWDGDIDESPEGEWFLGYYADSDAHFHVVRRRGEVVWDSRGDECETPDYWCAIMPPSLRIEI